jgi:hypothetical protein
MECQVRVVYQKNEPVLISDQDNKEQEKTNEGGNHFTCGNFVPLITLYFSDGV